MPTFDKCPADCVYFKGEKKTTLARTFLPSYSHVNFTLWRGGKERFILFDVRQKISFKHVRKIIKYLTRAKELKKEQLLAIIKIDDNDFNNAINFKNRHHQKGEGGKQEIERQV